MIDRAAVQWRADVSRPEAGFRWGRAGDDYIAEWAGVLSLRVGLTGNIKEVRASPGAPPDSVDKIRFGLAAAFARAVAGKTSLHASAVAWQGSAFLCVGPSGAGKSTMAARLCNREGVELLADDVAALDIVDGRWHVQPSEPRLWLLPYSCDRDHPKAPAARPIAGSSAAITWVVSLRFDDTLESPALRRLSGASAATALLQGIIRFDPTPALMQRELDLVGALTRQAPLYELVRSRDAAIDSVGLKMLALMEGATEWASA